VLRQRPCHFRHPAGQRPNVKRAIMSGRDRAGISAISLTHTPAGVTIQNSQHHHRPENPPTWSWSASAIDDVYVDSKTRDMNALKYNNSSNFKTAVQISTGWWTANYNPRPPATGRHHNTNGFYVNGGPSADEPKQHDFDPWANRRHQLDSGLPSPAPRSPQDIRQPARRRVLHHLTPRAAKRQPSPRTSSAPATGFVGPELLRQERHRPRSSTYFRPRGRAHLVRRHSCAPPTWQSFFLLSSYLPPQKDRYVSSHSHITPSSPAPLTAFRRRRFVRSRPTPAR